MTTHADSFVIAIDHPALPGHFPGNPVVPGVVVLDHVLAVAESWRGAPLAVTGLPQVKFLSPLLPEERADVTLADDGKVLRFAVHCGERAIAQGQFTLAVAE